MQEEAETVKLLSRLRSRLRRWWINPAEPPESIGKVGRYANASRPIPIELGFFLHPDGKVVQRMRNGDGDRRVDNLHIRAMVLEEYHRIRRLAERERAVADRLLKVRRMVSAFTTVRAAKS